MNSEIRKLLESVQAGKTSVDDAMLELKKAPFEDIGYAKVDLHRQVRQGAAEVIYGAGKTPEQIGGIIDAMLANGQNRVLITRMSPEAAAHVGSTRGDCPSPTASERWSSPPAAPATSPWPRKQR